MGKKFKIFALNIGSTSTKVAMFEDKEKVFEGKAEHDGALIKSFKSIMDQKEMRVTDIKNMCREILDGERKPTVSNGNNGGNDMMVDDKGVRTNFSSRTGMK